MLVNEFFGLLFSPYSLEKIDRTQLITNYRILSHMESSLIAVNPRITGKNISNSQWFLLICYHCGTLIDVMRFVMNLLILSPADSVNFCDPGVFFGDSRNPVDFLVLTYRLILWIWIFLSLKNNFSNKKPIWYNIHRDGNIYMEEFQHNHEEEWSKLRKEVRYLHKFLHLSYLMSAQGITDTLSLTAIFLYDPSHHSPILLGSSCCFGLSQLYLTSIQAFTFMSILGNFMILTKYRLEAIQTDMMLIQAPNVNLRKPDNLNPKIFVKRYLRAYIDMNYFNENFEFAILIGILSGFAVSLNAYYVAIVAKSSLILRINFIGIVLITIFITVGYWCLLGELVKLKVITLISIFSTFDKLFSHFHSNRIIKYAVVYAE